MAYEAATAALEGAAAPGTVIAVSQSPPFGLRKLSATLARTLGLDDALPLDVGGHAGVAPRRPRDRRGARGRGRGPGAGGGHRPPGELRGPRLRPAVGRRGDGLPGRRLGRASRAWAPRRAPRARSTTSGAWAPSPRRASASRCSSTPTGRPPARPWPRWRGHRAGHLRLRGGRRQPAPPRRPCAGWARPAWRPSSSSTRASWARSATWAPPRSASPWRSGSTGPSRASTCSPSATAAARRSRRTSRCSGPRRHSGAADQIPGEAIDLSTYYRWTRGRQAEPH